MTLRIRITLAVAAALAVLASLAGAASAGATVPVEGPWHGTTTDNLPVVFEVAAGQIVGLRFGINKGFCGLDTGSTPGTAPIAADGSWRYADPAGPVVTGEFTAPGRAEGLIWAPSRMAPSCPHSRVEFVAEPGAAPFRLAETVIPTAPGSSRRVEAPSSLDLRRDGSFHLYDLTWRGFGRDTSKAKGLAHIRVDGSRIRRLITVTVSGFYEDGPVNSYRMLSYALRGPLPSGVARSGSYGLG
jgi:hypothetical protein